MATIPKTVSDTMPHAGDDHVRALMDVYGPNDRSEAGLGLLTIRALRSHEPMGPLLRDMVLRGHRIQPEPLRCARSCSDILDGLSAIAGPLGVGELCGRGADAASAILAFPPSPASAALLSEALALGAALPERPFAEFLDNACSALSRAVAPPFPPDLFPPIPIDPAQAYSLFFEGCRATLAAIAQAPADPSRPPPDFESLSDPRVAEALRRAAVKPLMRMAARGDTFLPLVVKTFGQLAAGESLTSIQASELLCRRWLAESESLALAACSGDKAAPARQAARL